MAVETGRGIVTQTIAVASTATTNSLPVSVGQSAVMQVIVTAASTWTAGSVWAETSIDGGTTWSRFDGGELTYDKASTTVVGVSVALAGMPPGLLRARTNSTFVGSVDVILKSY